MKAALRRQLTRQWRRCLFLAQLRNLPPASSPIPLTCAGKCDGGGAQWHACLSVLALARAYGFPYLHTPFQIVEHGPAADSAWLRAWNALFDLNAAGIPTASSVKAQLACSDPLTLLHRRRRRSLPAEAMVRLEPGLLNPNLVFYERYEHPPLPDWMRLRSMGPIGLG